MSRFAKFSAVLAIVTGILLTLVFKPFSAFSRREHQKIPGGIGGIMLGDNIDQHKDRLLRPIGFVDPEEPYLTHHEVKPEPGYKAGMISVGNCLNKGRILRIKMKYGKNDNDFFKALKTSIEKVYNATPTYGGDPFQVYQLWKWRFESDNKIVVILALQRYMGNDEEHPHGNVIKLSLFSEIENERKCYEKHYPAETLPRANHPQPNIEHLIPIPLNLSPSLDSAP